MEGSFTPEQVAKIFTAKFTLKPGELELVYASADDGGSSGGGRGGGGVGPGDGDAGGAGLGGGAAARRAAPLGQPLLDLCTRHGVKIWAASVAQPAPPPPAAPALPTAPSAAAAGSTGLVPLTSVAAGAAAMPGYRAPGVSPSGNGVPPSGSLGSGGLSPRMPMLKQVASASALGPQLGMPPPTAKPPVAGSAPPAS